MKDQSNNTEPMIGYFVSGPKGSIVVLDEKDVEYYRARMACKDNFDYDDITATKVNVKVSVHDDAVVSDLAMQEDFEGTGIQYMDNLAIAWVHRDTVCAGLIHEEGELDYPPYFFNELKSMSGRPLRCRLWVNPAFGTCEVKNWDNQKAVELGLDDNYGGIVIHRDHLSLIKDVKAIITDFSLNVIKE